MNPFHLILMIAALWGLMALNVTYSAWAMVFTVLLLRDTSVLTPMTVLCAVVVLVCGIFAAADFREILSRRK